MAIPGIAVPGSIVAIGSLTSPAGAQGITGPQGPAGSGSGGTGGAGTLTTASFVMPTLFNTVAVAIQAVPWLSPGDKVLVAGAGKFLVVGVTSSTAISLFNTGDTGNTFGGNTIPSGAVLSVIPREENESLTSAYKDDFLTGSGSSYTNSVASAGTGAATGTTNNWTDASKRGIAYIFNGTTVSSYAWQQAATGAYLIGLGKLAFRAVIYPGVKPTTTTTAYAAIYIGLSNQIATNVPPTDFCGFVFDPNSGAANAGNNWSFLNRAGGVSSYRDTGFAYTASAWADLSFYVDSSAGSVYLAFPLGGTAPVASSGSVTSLPTANLGLLFAILAGSACTTKYLNYCDLWEVYHRSSTVIPVFRGENLIDSYAYLANVTAPTAPSQAVAAGFTTLNFDQEPGVWDISYASFGLTHKWQAGLWWQGVPSSSSFTVDSNGWLTITDFTNAVPGTSICTQAHDYTAGTYFLHGYFESMMYCTDWAAFWLYIADGPLGIPVNPADPTTWTSEIDIIECDPSPSFFNTMYCNVHKNTGGTTPPTNDQGGPGTLHPGVGTIVNAWHIFGCLWTTTTVAFYLDNVLVGSIPPWPSTVQPMTLILGAQPGGVQNIGGSPYPGSVTPATLKIQWVRVWQVPGYVNPPI